MPEIEPSVPQKRSGPAALSAWFISVLVLWLSLFLGTLPDFASKEYLMLGVILPLFEATLLTFVFGLIIGALLYLTRRRSNRWRRGFVYLMTATSVGWMFWSWSETTTRKKFERWVLKPIPSGVQEIVATGWSIFGSLWSFEFQADAAAIDSIIEHHQMSPLPFEALSELRKSKNVSIPSWVLNAKDGDGMKLFQRHTPDSMTPEPRKARTVWLAYYPGQPRAWFLYDVPT